MTRCAHSHRKDIPAIKVLQAAIKQQEAIEAAAIQQQEAIHSTLEALNAALVAGDTDLALEMQQLADALEAVRRECVVAVGRSSSPPAHASAPLLTCHSTADR